MSKTHKAFVALLSTILLWSIMVIVAKGTVLYVSAFILHFLRMSIAFIFFLPIILIKKSWQKKYYYKLIGISLFSTINLVFFIWGIQFTTASASQLIYALMPILIVIIDTFFHKIKYNPQRIFGILLGLAGIIYIIYLSSIEKGQTISGSLYGNLMMFIAMSGWLFYILFSKRISKYFTPIEISSTNILVSFTISIPLFLRDIYWLKKPLFININVIYAALVMGFLGTFLTYILYQYAIKHTSPLIVSLSSYIQPISVTLLAMIFLGEKLTINFLVGCFLIMSGIFLSSNVKLFKY